MKNQKWTIGNEVLEYKKISYVWRWALNGYPITWDVAEKWLRYNRR